MGKSVSAISLFSGIGGFEVGFRDLGVRFHRMLEWDPKCCETLSINFDVADGGHREVKPTDITKVAAKDFYRGKVDYIVGGPPCQSFSAAGRRAGGVRGINDTRGSLFWYYCQYVKHFTPKAFVFENVRGILSSKKGEDFKIICDSFREVGYRLYWRVLNAADYGVPQIRERLFLVGVREDIKKTFLFPFPTHGPDSIGKRPYVLVGDALRDITDEKEVVPPYGGKYGHLLEEIPEGENYLHFTEEMGHPSPKFAWRSKFSGFLQKLSRNDLSKTIVAYQGRYDGPFHWHNRKLTVAELRRLQGFPDEYILNHGYVECVKQIGNSVCPPVAHQIGRALLFQIEGDSKHEVPLMPEEFRLTFDKRKRVKAERSRSKKQVSYRDIVQPSLFGDERQNETQVAGLEDSVVVKKTRNESGSKFTMLSAGKITKVEIVKDSTVKGKSELVLKFHGSVASRIRELSIVCLSSTTDEAVVEQMWSEAHRAVHLLTTYESLHPLWGHFTEPYPKFTIEFKSNVRSKAVRFQKWLLTNGHLNHVLPLERFLTGTHGGEELLRQMKEYGFDVRTHQTNRTIAPNHFRVCYPFTVPSALRKVTVWTQENESKKTDFNIGRLIGR